MFDAGPYQIGMNRAAVGAVLDAYLLLRTVSRTVPGFQVDCRKVAFSGTSSARVNLVGNVDLDPEELWTLTLTTGGLAERTADVTNGHAEDRKDWTMIRLRVGTKGFTVWLSEFVETVSQKLALLAEESFVREGKEYKS